MFHVVLPLIAVLPLVVVLFVLGAALIGVLLILSAIIMLIVRAVRKSKKKASLIAAIIMLIFGVLSMTPITLVGVWLMSATPNSERVEVKYSDLPILEVDGDLNSSLVYEGEHLIVVDFLDSNEWPDREEMEPLTRVSFSTRRLKQFVLLKGKLSDGCDFYRLDGDFTRVYVKATDEAKMREDYPSSYFRN